MRTRSGRQYLIVLPPKAPDLTILQSLRSYLDTSTQAASPKEFVCRVCQQMLEYWDIRNATSSQTRRPTLARRLHRRPLRQLQASAVTGCHLCSLLNRRLQWALRTVADYASYSLELRPPCDNGWPSGIGLGSISLVRRNSLAGYGLLEVKAWTPCDRYYKYLANPSIPKSLKYVSTANEAAFDLAKSWLKQCITHHGRCSIRSDDPVFTPSRLLKIGKCRLTNVTLMEVQLLEKDQIHEACARQQPAYVALSHCWGSGQPLKLEKESQSSLINGIVIDNLPRTYQEAVIVAAMLGYSWIWIDSLCIIQDSQEDWEVEAQLMGKVYSNCALNLAALDARDCRQGLFSQRNAYSFRGYKVRTRTGNIIQVAHRDIYWNGPEREGLHDPLPGLLSRSWVVQEVTLSPRTLYYCSDMLFWECRSCIACEQHPRLSKSRTWLYSNQMGKKLFNDMLASGRASRVVDYWTWAMLVGRYSETRCTYGKDRYYAFLGLAEMVQKSSGMVLLVGLWKATLLQELAWQASLWKATIRQPWLPSWSWLSLDTQVSLVHDRGEDLDVRHYAEIIKTPKSDVHFSEHTILPASTRSIELRAPLLKLQSWLQLERQSRIHVQCDWGNLFFSFDIDVEDGAKLHVLALFQAGGGRDFYGLLIIPSPVEPKHWVRVGCCQGGAWSHLDPIVKATEVQLIALI